MLQAAPLSSTGLFFDRSGAGCTLAPQTPLSNGSILATVPLTAAPRLLPSLLQSLVFIHGEAHIFMRQEGESLVLFFTREAP